MDEFLEPGGTAARFFHSPLRSAALTGLLCALALCAPAFAQGAIPSSPASTPAWLAGWSPFLELQLWQAYDAIPISKLDGDWSDGYSPKAGRNIMLQRNRAEIGVKKDQWSLGWEWRQDITLTTDQATLEFFRLYRQRLKPAGPTTYELAVQFNAWSAQGPRLGRWFGAPASPLRVNLSAALYTGAILREGDGSATVHYLPPDQYQFDARRTDANSRYRYPFMQHEPAASGASVSAAMAWRLSEALALDVKVNDLLSTMRWRNVPVTEESIGSAVTEYDAQGFINYRPLLSGTNRQVSQRSMLARSGLATLSYRFGAWGVATEVERVAGGTIPTLALAHQYGWGKLTARVDTRFGGIGVGVETERFHLQLQADSLHRSQAKVLGVSMGVRY